MSSFYNYNSHHHPVSANPQPSVSSSSHHGGRGRRAPRVSQNSHKQQFRGGPRKEEEVVALTNFRLRFESQRSFNLDDDMEFCPNLLTESDHISINSSSSDRSSLSSGSPESSPQSHQVTPDSAFSLNSNHGSHPFVPSYQTPSAPLKLHQPAATRIRNAIPIVNPLTGVRSSPPQSVSPARMMNPHVVRRW